MVILTHVLGNGLWSSPGDGGLSLSRNGSVEPPRIFYGNDDVSPFTFSLLLFLVSVSATLKHDEVCHVDEVLKVMDDEQRARTQDDRAASVVNFVLRHSGSSGGKYRKTFSPFHSRFAPSG